MTERDEDRTEDREPGQQFAYQNDEMMRCCLATLCDLASKGNLPDTDGLVVTCTCKHGTMVRIAGVWRWAGDE